MIVSRFIQTHVKGVVKVTKNVYGRISIPSKLPAKFQTTVRCMYTNTLNLSKSAYSDCIAKMLNTKLEDKIFVYSEADAIKYALSIGAKVDQDFHYVFEQHPQFSVYTTFLNSLAVTVTLDLICEGLPGGELIGLKKELHDLLHGEEYVELYRLIPSCGIFTVKTAIIDVMDKNKFCKVTFENMIVDENGIKLGRILSSFLFMNRGGDSLGSVVEDTTKTQRKSSNVMVPSSILPDRLPDATLEQETSQNQSALYRLTGDLNPLHIDPAVASEMGYSRPILHGLCSYGFALRHVLKTYANNDSTLFKSMKAQFSKPVYPGNTLVTEMWKERGRIIFQTKVKENCNIVLKGGFVDLSD